MTGLQLVLAVAVAAVLALVWFRNRRIVRNRTADADADADADVFGRGVIGEVAMAYEDVAGQFIEESDDKPRRSDTASGAGQKD